MTEKELKAYHQKMSPEELQMFFHFKKRGGRVPAKKGKGSYNRKKMEREWQKMKCQICGNKTDWDSSVGTEEFIVCNSCLERLIKHFHHDSCYETMKFIFACGYIRRENKR